MNKYLFQALTIEEKQIGASGYEVEIFSEDLNDATENAIRFFNDESRVVSLVNSAKVYIDASTDPYDESGSVYWSVCTNAGEVASGVEFTEEEALAAANQYIYNEVQL